MQYLWVGHRDGWTERFFEAETQTEAAAMGEAWALEVFGYEYETEHVEAVGIHPITTEDREHYRAFVKQVETLKDRAIKYGGRKSEDFKPEPWTIEQWMAKNWVSWHGEPLTKQEWKA
jgi:hypothetical protein